MKEGGEQLSYDQGRLARAKVKRGFKTQSEDADLLQDPIVEVFMAAAIAFQDVKRGKAWLLSPIQAFDHQPPIAAINTPQGRERIMNELGIIAHGMF